MGDEAPKKILIVEDDQFTRELYQDVFKLAGFAVETATDGDEGLVKLKQGGWNLVLLDIMMPRLDGLQVLKQLKENPPATPNGKIVVLTNLPQDPIVKEALQNGASSCFMKSELNPDELVNKVKAFL
jgi:DNA-binding response OmpR family regulator